MGPCAASLPAGVEFLGSDRVAGLHTDLLLLGALLELLVVGGWLDLTQQDWAAGGEV